MTPYERICALAEIENRLEVVNTAIAVHEALLQNGDKKAAQELRNYYELRNKLQSVLWLNS